MADLICQFGARDGARTRDLRRDRPGNPEQNQSSLTFSSCASAPNKNKVSGRPASLDHLEETFPVDRLRGFSLAAREAYLLQEIDSLFYLFNSADVGFGDRKSLTRLQPLLNARVAGALQIKRHRLAESIVAMAVLIIRRSLSVF